MLDKLQSLVDDLKNTSSSNDKVEIIKDYLEDNKDLQKIFYYVYHPTYQYYVSSANCKKNKSLSKGSHKNIFELLDNLKDRTITGHDAIAAVNSFTSKNENYKDLIHNIIDKDLKIRVGDKLVNKSIPDLIPAFEVALAEKYEEKIVDFSEGWFSSRKLDGARCIAIVDSNGNSTFFSRTGKTFDTLSNVASAIRDADIKNVVLDGELCLFNADGSENFQAIMKELRRKDHAIPNPSYKIFDVLSHEEFFSRKGEAGNILEKRLEKLCNLLDKNKSSILSALKQEKIRDQDHFLELVKESSDCGWEGLILRKNSTYKGKRSKDLIKYKSFFDAEYKVIDCEMGPFRYVQNNKEKEEVMLSCVMIEHKNNIVRVGSGFTIEQRKFFHNSPKDIIGKTITVQYFAESENQNGGVSLRFPVIKHIYEGERDM